MILKEENEIIELAAESIWLHYKGRIGNRYVIFNQATNQEYDWNPLEDNAEAFGLLVHHGMEVIVDQERGIVEVMTVGSDTILENKKDYKNDLGLTTRVAITKMAADIQRKAKK